MTKIIPRQLADAMSRLSQTIESRTPNPILGFVRIAATGDALEMVATDLDIRLTTSVPCEGTLAPICVDASRLSSALGRIKDRAEASVELADGNEPTLRITSGRSEFKLPTLPATGFPNLEAPTSGVGFTLPGAAFRSILLAHQASICHEETRYYLNGVAMQPGNIDDGQASQSLTFVSTDGHKAYARHMSVDDLPSELAPIIIPTKTTLVIAKIFDKAEFLTMELDKDRIRLSGGGMEMISRLVEGTFPDWRRIMPRRDPSLVFDANSFAASIETAGAVTGALAKKGKAVKMVFSESETELITVDFENPNFTGRDVCQHEQIEKPDLTEIGANYKYMVEMIGALDTETVQLSFSGFSGPITMTSASHDDRRAVVMPMRVG